MSQLTTFASNYNFTSNDGERARSHYFPVFISQIGFGAIAVIVNLLVICVFIISRLRSSFSCMLCNLAIANLLMGISLSTRAIIEIIDEDVGYTVQFICHFTLMTVIMNVGTCITTIFCMCLNMYLSIGYALQFVGGLSLQKTIIFLTCCWIFWFGYSLTIFGATTNSANSNEAFSCNFASGRYHNTYVLTFVGISCVISCLTILFLYKTIRAIRTQMMKVMSSNVPQTSHQSSGDFMVKKSQPSQILRHMSITITLILGLYIVCWGPFILIHIIANSCPNECSISEDIIISVSTLPIIHSIANIFIYSFRSKEFRGILFDRVLKRLTKLARPMVGDDKHDVEVPPHRIIAVIPCEQPMNCSSSDMSLRA